MNRSIALLFALSIGMVPMMLGAEHSAAADKPAPGQGDEVQSKEGREMKVAVVDVMRVFEEHYQMKDLRKRIEEEMAIEKKEEEDRAARIEKLRSRWNEKQAVINDKLVNDNVRRKAEAEAALALAEITSLERGMERVDLGRVPLTPEQKVLRMRKGLLEEIRAKIEEIAQRGGYDLVLDKAGADLKGGGVVFGGGNVEDLTDVVIRELNARAEPKRR